MKKFLNLVVLLLLVIDVVAQVKEGEGSYLDIIFKIMEESENTVSKEQIVYLLDSLDYAIRIKEEENKYKINEKGDTVYSIGDKAHGGIVFWLESSAQHGLVICGEDIEAEVFPYYGEGGQKDKTVVLKGDSVYTGKYNTRQILDNRTVSYSAALICSQYRGGGYNDWYLPSKYELGLAYLQYKKGTIGYFAKDFYWSSSEDVNDVAWLFRFYDGQKYNYLKYGSTAFRVRAVRTF